LSSKILDEETDEEESLDISLEVSEDEELVEESSKKAEPKGNFNFLNLDEIDALKNNYFLREVFLSLQKIGKKDKNNLIMLENTRFLA
jgi:DNA polymerase-3 subunit alpha